MVKIYKKSFPIEMIKEKNCQEQYLLTFVNKTILSREHGDFVLNKQQSNSEPDCVAKDSYSLDFKRIVSPKLMKMLSDPKDNGPVANMLSVIRLFDFFKADSNDDYYNEFTEDKNLIKSEMKAFCKNLTCEKNVLFTLCDYMHCLNEPFNSDDIIEELRKELTEIMYNAFSFRTSKRKGLDTLLGCYLDSYFLLFRWEDCKLNYIDKVFLFNNRDFTHTVKSTQGLTLLINAYSKR